MTMTNIAHTLYTIQTYELAIDEARGRVKAIDEALAHNEAVAKARADFEQAEKSLHHTQAEVRDLELEVQSLKQKIEEVDTLLYSGKLINPKELQERQDELASLKRRLIVLEERLLEAMNRQEREQEQFARIRQDLEAAEAQRDQDNADMIIERDQLDSQIKEKLKARKTFVKKISDDVLKAYRKLRKRKNGQAVAVLKGSSCSACGIQQPTTEVQRVLDNEELVYCIGCGRILVTDS